MLPGIIFIPQALVIKAWTQMSELNKGSLAVETYEGGVLLKMIGE